MVFFLGRFTGWNLPVVEAGVAHSNGSEAPAPLRHRPRFGGAGITETFSAGTTVVLGVVGLELLAAFMAFLQFLEEHCHLTGMETKQAEDSLF